MDETNEFYYEGQISKATGKPSGHGNATDYNDSTNTVEGTWYEGMLHGKGKC